MSGSAQRSRWKLRSVPPSVPPFSRFDRDFPCMSVAVHVCCIRCVTALIEHIYGCLRIPPISLGVKWSQVQILSARPQKSCLSSRFYFLDGTHVRRHRKLSQIVTTDSPPDRTKVRTRLVLAGLSSLGCGYQPCADQASRRGQQRFVDRSRSKSQDGLSLSVAGSKYFTHDG
jgi:hypothetical protein